MDPKTKRNAIIAGVVALVIIIIIVIIVLVATSSEKPSGKPKTMRSQELSDLAEDEYPALDEEPTYGDFGELEEDLADEDEIQTLAADSGVPGASISDTLTLAPSASVPYERDTIAETPSPVVDSTTPIKTSTGVVYPTSTLSGSSLGTVSPTRIATTYPTRTLSSTTSGTTSGTTYPTRTLSSTSYPTRTLSSTSYPTTSGTTYPTRTLTSTDTTRLRTYDGTRLQTTDPTRTTSGTTYPTRLRTREPDTTSTTSTTTADPVGDAWSQVGSYFTTPFGG